MSAIAEAGLTAAREVVAGAHRIGFDALVARMMSAKPAGRPRDAPKRGGY